jgi:hypothetical protein
MIDLKESLDRVKSRGDAFESTSHGLFRESLKKGMSIFFSSRNLKGEIKKDKDGNDRLTKVVVFVKTDNKEPFKINCTQPLSENIREALANGNKKNDILKALVHFPLVKINDIYYLTNKANTGLDLTEEILDEKSESDIELPF